MTDTTTATARTDHYQAKPPTVTEAQRHPEEKVWLAKQNSASRCRA